MSSPKKFLLSIPPYYGIDRSIARAFERNGVEAVLASYRYKPYFWERTIRLLSNKVLPLKRLIQPLLKIPLVLENRNFIKIAERSKPDCIFIVKGDTLFPQTIRYLKSKYRVPCISYQWDDPLYSSAGQDGIDDYRRKNFQGGMHDYDHVFVFDKHHVEKLKKKGVAASYLPLATDEEVYRAIDLSDEERNKYGFDVCFVGMPNDNRVEALNRLNGFNVGVFGDFWERYLLKMPLRYFKGKANGSRVIKIYRGSKIALNIHHPQSVQGLNTRAFDIPSCGAFQIMDYKEGVEELFDLGQEIVCYHCLEELGDLVRFYLSHPEIRSRIAEKGQERVRREHTWYHRIATVMSSIESGQPQAMKAS